MRKKLIAMLITFAVSGVFFSVYATPKTVSQTVTLYTVDSQTFRLFADKAVITFEEDNPQDRADKTLHALQNNVNFALQSEALFPKVKNGMQVYLQGDTAYVNFSKEFAKKHCGGTLSEKMTIYSIVNTLTSLPDIQSVRFTVDGKENSELKGHLDLNSPYKFNDRYVWSAPL